MSLADEINDAITDHWLQCRMMTPSCLVPVVEAAVSGYTGPMTPTENVPAETVKVTETASATTEVTPTAEVAVELPAKVVETTEVAATPETAGSDGQPDAATEAMEAEPKQD